MRERVLGRWKVLGALGAAWLCLSACENLPRTGGEWQRDPLNPRTPEEAGFNGTLQDLPTSIDPRTPETSGTPGRSLQDDVAGTMKRWEEGIGGAGPFQQHEGAPSYLRRGTYAQGLESRFPERAGEHPGFLRNQPTQRGWLPPTYP